MQEGLRSHRARGFSSGQSYQKGSRVIAEIGREGLGLKISAQGLRRSPPALYSGAPICHNCLVSGQQNLSFCTSSSPTQQAKHPFAVMMQGQCATLKLLQFILKVDKQSKLLIQQLSLCQCQVHVIFCRTPKCIFCY